MTNVVAELALLKWFTVHGSRLKKLFSRYSLLITHYSLLIPVILFALTFAGCIPSGILKTNPVKIASKLEQKNTDEAIRILENALKKRKLNKKMKIEVLLKLSSLYEKEENFLDPKIILCISALARFISNLNFTKML